MKSPYASKTVTIKRTTISPEMAENILANYNPRNRTVTDAAVLALALDITEGRWQLTHQGLAFDVEGNLIDGQHRLHAIVLAGKPVDIFVTCGLPTPVMDVIDCGGAGPRAPQDTVFITDGTVISKACRGWCNLTAAVLETGSIAGSIPKMTVHHLRTTYATHKDAIEAINASLGSRVARTSIAPVAAAFLICWKTRPEKTIEMAHKLRTGENLQVGDPALALRNYLLTNWLSASPSIRDGVNRRVFGALDSYIEGRPLKNLRDQDGARVKYVAEWHKASKKA